MAKKKRTPKDDSDDEESPIVVAYYELDMGGDFPGGNPRAEMWSDGKWRVTHEGVEVLHEMAGNLNDAFPPSRFDSPMWDCVLKAAEEAAKLADAELFIGKAYRPKSAEPGEGIVY